MKIIGKITCKSRSGFSAIELLIGSAIILVVGISLYAGITVTFSMMGSARDRLRATQIMLERVEGLRLYNWNQLVSSNMLPTAFTNYYYPFATNGESRGMAYTGSVIVTNADLNPSTTYSDLMRKVIVEVNWVSGNVTNHNKLITYVARDGIQNYIYNN